MSQRSVLRPATSQTSGSSSARAATHQAPYQGPYQTRAWLEVDLRALQDNAAALRARAGVPLLPMIKGDAYGLGAIPVARALSAPDRDPDECWGFGVATVAEGVELREAGITRPIIVFTPILREDLLLAHEAALTPTLHHHELIDLWARMGGRGWHLSIDTGMSREGVRWDEVASIKKLVHEFLPEGAYTHFHSSARDPHSIEVQEGRFQQALDVLEISPPLLHCEASAALERRGKSKWTAVRPGVFLYGVATASEAQGGLRARRVASLRARVVDLRTIQPGDTVSYDATYQADRPRRIATLGIGYADGYRRAFNDVGVALIRGRRAPVVGIVTMDMTMVDVTDIPCELGDVATLIGADGDEALEINDVAALGALSPYELLAGLRLRLEHTYHSRPDGAH